MRVLVVSNLYPPFSLGGYEVECSVVVDHLRARGHAVTVLTSDYRAAEAAPQDGVRRVLPFIAGDQRSALAAPLTTPRAATLLRAVLQELRPDLVYYWNGAQIPAAVLWLALHSGHPVAVRVCERWFAHLFGSDQFMRHLRPGDRGPARAWAAVIRTVNRRMGLDPAAGGSPAVCWNSAALRAECTAERARRGLPPLQARMEAMIHSTAARGPVFAAVQRAPQGLELAFVGRVDAAKGAPTAAEALVRLHREHGIAATLTFAGVAADRGALEAIVAAGGLDPAAVLRFLGPVAAEEVAALLARAAVLLIPSVGFDAFPQTCLEGALARVPVVASTVGGIPEALADEEHALLHPPGDAVGCAAAIARTLAEPDATAARVARARARADALSLDAYLAATEAFVEEAAR